MINKCTILITAALASGIAYQPEAISFTLPTPIVTTIESTINPQDDTLLVPVQNSAVRVEGISIETIPGEFSFVYNACFEYGSYSDIFLTDRSATGAGPCVNVTNANTPAFLGSPEQAQFAAGGLNPANKPTSNGILTALNNALASNNVNRVQGFGYADFLDSQGQPIPDGVITPPAELFPFILPDFPFFPNNDVEKTSTIIFLVPYAFNETTGEVTGVTVTYDSSQQIWRTEDTSNISTSDFQQIIARFEDTGERIDINEVPEPSSVIGLFLTGIFMLSRRR